MTDLNAKKEQWPLPPALTTAYSTISSIIMSFMRSAEELHHVRKRLWESVGNPEEDVDITTEHLLEWALSRIHPQGKEAPPLDSEISSWAKNELGNIRQMLLTLIASSPNGPGVEFNPDRPTKELLRMALAIQAKSPYTAPPDTHRQFLKDSKELDRIRDRIRSTDLWDCKEGTEALVNKLIQSLDVARHECDVLKSFEGEVPDNVRKGILRVREAITGLAPLDHSKYHTLTQVLEEMRNKIIEKEKDRIELHNQYDLAKREKGFAIQAAERSEDRLKEIKYLIHEVLQRSGCLPHENED